MPGTAAIIRLIPTLVLLAASPPTWAEDKADLVVVEKSKGTLILYKSGKTLATYHVAFGGDPKGPKQSEGDGKTPEGRYVLDSKNTQSGYHKAFHISYPNQSDIAKAKKRGVSPGGAIMVHGQKNGYGWASFITQRLNWTKGCVALSNSDLDDMWNRVDAGTPIEIRP